MDNLKETLDEFQEAAENTLTEVLNNGDDLESHFHFGMEAEKEKILKKYRNT